MGALQPCTDYPYDNTENNANRRHPKGHGQSLEEHVPIISIVENAKIDTVRLIQPQEPLPDCFHLIVSLHTPSTNGAERCSTPPHDCLTYIYCAFLQEMELETVSTSCSTQ